jgi:hypothetical protein
MPCPAALRNNWDLTLTLPEEGIPSLIGVFFAYFLLPNGPSECPFLNERENFIIGTRASRGRGGDTEKKVNFKQVFAAFKDYKNYLQAIIIFCFNVCVPG